MSKDDWIFLLLVGLVVCFVFAVIYADQVSDMKEEVAQVEALKQAIVRVHNKSLSMRIAFEIGMPLVAKDKWEEDLYPAIEDALELCVEVSQ